MSVNCRIVLVRPHYAGNLGSTARVMRNFGLSDLVLVDPLTSPQELEARRMATHGLCVLDSARTVSDLGAALSDCVFTLATSGLTKGIFRNTFVGTPREKLPELIEASAAGPVALVFGPEPHGLSNAEITRCHGLLHIPVHPDATALNLAQAVAICCYELYTATAPSRVSELTTAPFEEQERMFNHLQEAFEKIGYLFGTRADGLMHAMRHVIGRARPTHQEVKLLHGLARQLLWWSKTRE